MDEHRPATRLALFTEAVSLYRRAGDRVGRGVESSWSSAMRIWLGTRSRLLIFLMNRALDLSVRWAIEPARVVPIRPRRDCLRPPRSRDGRAILLTEAARFSDLGIDFAAYRTLILLADVRRLRREWLRAISHYDRHSKSSMLEASLREALKCWRAWGARGRDSTSRSGGSTAWRGRRLASRGWDCTVSL